jgi:uncharacterized membrane protein
MTLLILGLLLWTGAHVFKRVAPGARARLTARMGEKSKGIFAIALGLSVLLMVLGYRQAEWIPVWDPPLWTVHLNNLLNLIAVALFGLGSSKSRLRGKMRHPQLTGFSLWCVAHLLVNGDWASIVLFGSMAVWALAEVALINARTAPPAPFTGGSLKGDIRLGVIALVLYLVITAVHAWLGVWPFPA